jgi:uncharacterized protein YeaO (DUF488 family)
MLKTKSIYEPKEKADGIRVLITRFYPRGVKKDRFDRWMKELSPSKELLKAYRSKEKSWDQFESEFRAELEASPEAQEAIRSLRSDSARSPVTLLCYESSGLPCHRYIIASIIDAKRRGVSKGYYESGYPIPMPQKRDEIVNPDVDETPEEEKEEDKIDKTEDSHEKAKRRKKGRTRK